MSGRSLRLGTRGSALALAQASQVREKLLALDASASIELVTIKTTGDTFLDTPLARLGGKGVFIKEIEDALLDRRIDLAVHSLKDLPTSLPAGLVLAAILEREDPRDCVVSRFGEQLLELPRGAVVGTSSLRRQAQILAAKKGIRVQEMRGNLDTRLKKVLNGDVDSIVVALAGLRRLGRENDISEVLSFQLMLPAPGQGCLAVEVRTDDAAAREWAARLDHPASRAAAEAERSLLAALGGGCRVPIAAHAAVQGETLRLEALVISPDGRSQVRGALDGKSSHAAAVGGELGKKLQAQGAGDILAAVQELDRPVAGA